METRIRAEAPGHLALIIPIELGLGIRGSKSDAAWIGAAAGVGFVIGFVAGLAKAGTGWSPEPATPPACQAELTKATAPAETE